MEWHLEPLFCIINGCHLYSFYAHHINREGIGFGCLLCAVGWIFGVTLSSLYHLVLHITDGVILFSWRRGSILGTFISIDPCWIIHMPLSKSLSITAWKQYIYSTSNIQKGDQYTNYNQVHSMGRYADSAPHFSYALP